MKIFNFNLCLLLVLLQLGFTVIGKTPTDKEIETAINKIINLKNKNKPQEDNSQLSSQLEILIEGGDKSIQILLEAATDPNESTELKLELLELSRFMISYLRDNININKSTKMQTEVIDTSSLQKALERETETEMIVKIINTIGDCKNPNSFWDLVSYTVSPNNEIRCSAVFALTKLKDKRAIPILMDIAETEVSDDVRLLSVSGLGEFKYNSKVLNKLIEIFYNETTEATTKNKIKTLDKINHEILLMRIIGSIGLIETPESIDFLKSVLDDHQYTQDVKINAIIAIGRLKTVEAENILLDIFYNSTGRFKFHSADGLANINGDKYLSEFKQAVFEETDAFVKMKLEQIIMSVEGAENE
jgi:HEAT repeat protein